MLIRTNNSSYKWVVLAISFLLMLTFAISLQALPPLFDQIAKDISFSDSQAGMLMGAYAIPGIFLPFLIAFLAARYNKKSILLIALLLMITGLIAFSLSGSFFVLLANRLIAGVGATAVIILAPLLITLFFDQKNIGIAMGVFNAAVPCGTVVAANLFGILGEVFEWRAIMLGIAAFIGVVWAIVFFVLAIPPKENLKNSNMPAKESLHSIWSNLGLWSLALIWTLANAQLLSYVTFASQFYQSFGMSGQRAGLLTSLIMLIPIFLSPLIGIIIDKTGWKKRLIVIGSVIVAISFILIARGLFALPMWAVALGIGFSPIPVLVFALLPEVVEAYQMGMGLGILTSASNLGIAAGPSAFGFFLDLTERNYNVAFMILAVASLGIIFALGGLKAKTKQDLPNM